MDRSSSSSSGKCVTVNMKMDDCTPPHPRGAMMKTDSSSSQRRASKRKITTRKLHHSSSSKTAAAKRAKKAPSMACSSSWEVSNRFRAAVGSRTSVQIEAGQKLTLTQSCPSKCGGGADQNVYLYRAGIGNLLQQWIAISNAQAHNQYFSAVLEMSHDFTTKHMEYVAVSTRKEKIVFTHGTFDIEDGIICENTIPLRMQTVSMSVAAFRKLGEFLVEHLKSKDDDSDNNEYEDDESSEKKTTEEEADETVADETMKEEEEETNSEQSKTDDKRSTVAPVSVETRANEEAKDDYTAPMDDTSDDVNKDDDVIIPQTQDDIIYSDNDPFEDNARSDDAIEDESSVTPFIL